MIAAVVPVDLAATARSIYAVGAAGMVALLTLGSGALYARFGSRGFLGMALLCAFALPLTRRLRTIAPV